LIGASNVLETLPLIVASVYSLPTGLPGSDWALVNVLLLILAVLLPIGLPWVLLFWLPRHRRQRAKSSPSGRDCGTAIRRH
jgi:hypothetical protein